MAALTSDRDTVFRNGDEFEFEAAAAIFAGAMVCLNGDGKAVPASITAGLTSVVGVAQRRAAAGEKVLVRRGMFAFGGKSSDEPALAQVGSICYATDDNTVQKTTESNAPVAGVVRDVTEDGIWVECGYFAPTPAAPGVGG